jgi:hypothetical protein
VLHPVTDLPHLLPRHVSAEKLNGPVVHSTVPFVYPAIPSGYDGYVIKGDIRENIASSIFLNVKNKDILKVYRVLTFTVDVVF